HLDQGRSYHEKGDYNRAIDEFTRAIELEPNRAGYYNLRGVSYSARNDHDQAIADYSAAIKLEPGNAVMHCNRGVSYYRKRDYDRARADIARGIDLDPVNAFCINGLGNVYLDNGEYDRAIAEYTRAIALDSKKAAYYGNRALSYRAKRDKENACRDYGQAVALGWTENRNELEPLCAAPAPCVAGRIDADSAVRQGTLTAGSCDAQHRQGSKTDLYSFNGAQGQSLKIALGSAAFDAYLILVGPDGSVVQNDDGGGGRNALIDLKVPSTGTYTIEATTENKAGVGDYSLIVSRCYTVKPIAAGQTRGSLAGIDCDTPYRRNSKAELYLFSGRAGQRVTLTMNKSPGTPNLDPFLILVGPDGRKAAEDDDGGGSLNARIVNYSLPSSGMYVIVATSADAYSANGTKGTGEFTLSLSLD
ncbi:MAG: tetratricopeptide repeat protein, partial [Candidatus Binatia bacterium]